VIHPLESTETTQATQTGGTGGVSPTTPAAKTFAAVLATHKSTVAEKSSPHQSHRHKDPIVSPDGEVWRPVKSGNHYAKITEGPRAGMYINLARGERRGEVFSLEVRDGVRVHVYTGKNGKEKVIEAVKDSGRVDRAERQASHAARRPRSEEWAAVKGVSNYADIVSGPRNGWYVNTSGGERDGMLFHIVHKGDKVFHVYGKGKHKQVVEVDYDPNKASHNVGRSNGGKDDDKKTDGTKGADTKTGGTTPSESESDTKSDTRSSTGGVAAPSED
jgi:hypothetical protein